MKNKPNPCPRCGSEMKVNTYSGNLPQVTLTCQGDNDCIWNMSLGYNEIGGQTAEDVIPRLIKQWNEGTKKPQTASTKKGANSIGDTILEMITKSLGDEAVSFTAGAYIRPTFPATLPDGKIVPRTMVLMIAFSDLGVEISEGELSSIEDEEFWLGQFIFIPEKKWKGAPISASTPDNILTSHMHPDEFDRQIYP